VSYVALPGFELQAVGQSQSDFVDKHSETNIIIFKSNNKRVQYCTIYQIIEFLIYTLFYKNTRLIFT